MARKHAQSQRQLPQLTGGDCAYFGSGMNAILLEQEPRQEDPRFAALLSAVARGEKTVDDAWAEWTTLRNN